MNEIDKYPLVSVVLATYNGEKFLEEQLQSIFLQTYPNIEIIAIDDNSSDNTTNILRKAALSHPNMKVYINETNIGFIKNFERGCTLASGELFAFCDQDDYWDMDKIMKTAAVIGDYSIVYCDSKVCDENLNSTGKNISNLVNFRSWNNCLQLAVFCRIYAHTMLFKRSLFNQANPFLNVIPPDWWLPYLSTFNGGMKYFPEALVLYRQHSSNVTGVIGGREKKENKLTRGEKKSDDLFKIRKRIKAFYTFCPQSFNKEKKVLHQLMKCYESFSFKNNIRRVLLFLHYRDVFLSVKKHSYLHKIFFCLKMFVKIK